MSKFGKLLILIVVFAALIVVVYFAQKQPAMAPVVDETPVVKEEITEVPASDLVSFTVLPNSKVNGILSYQGTIKGGYFFEGNILVNILDSNKSLLRAGHAQAMTEWMTVEPVEFEGNIDFTGLPVGPAYIEIHNDNASGLPENDKSILIPIKIEGVPVEINL